MLHNSNQLSWAPLRNALRFRSRVKPAAVAALFFAATFHTAQAAAPKSLTHAEIAEANKPGTIMIVTDWTATITVGEQQILGQALVEFAQNQAKLGLVPNNPNAEFKAMFDELLNHPEHYLIPSRSEVIQQQVHALASGTGFIVTPDGYIVTNAHVVYEDRDSLLKTMVSDWQYNEMKPIFQQDFTNFKKDIISASGKVGGAALQASIAQEIEDRENDFIRAELSYYVSNTKLQKVETQVFALMGVAIPGLPTQPRGTPCDVRKRGEVTPGKDVAILKIEQNNLPTVPVGDDSTLRVGDSIIVLGYPGAAEINKSQMGVESTLTQGDLSARKGMPGGWQALQTSAEINHGNSGGPAFNDRGEVIGIATFGPVEEGVRGINFLVPISVAKEFLNELNIKPQQSHLSALYQDGIASMTGSCYKGALEKFKEVSDLSPGFPFVQDKITQSRNAIDQGMDRCWMPSPIYIAGGVAVLLIILLAIFLLMRRKSPAPVPAFQPAMAGGVPMGPGPTVIDVAPPRLPQELPPGVGQSFGSVQGTSGAVAGKRFEVTKQGLLIGRDASKCQIVINEDAVSKEHAWIVPVDGSTVVIDRGSTNGTFVNSIDSPKVSKVRLQNGDKIFIGKGVASFTYYTS